MTLSLAAADSRHESKSEIRLRSSHKPTGIANILVPNEDVDVFPDLSLLSCDAISDPRVKYPQRSQRIGNCRGRGFYFNAAVPTGEFAQGTRDVKRHRHDHLLLGRDL